MIEKSELMQLTEKEDYAGIRLRLEQLDEKQILALMSDPDIAILAANAYLLLGERAMAFQWIRAGLLQSPTNSELFLLLGQYYQSENVCQARICYEQAYFYCREEADRQVITAFLDAIKEEAEAVRKVSIVILTYNRLQDTKGCINSLRKTLSPDFGEIIVVDNASSDDTVSWLKEQKDLKTAYNQENRGFPAGCNQGIAMADPGNDIFLLNSDTMLLDNSLFYLRLGLYSSDAVGAAGSMSNYAGNGQMLEIPMEDGETAFRKAQMINCPESMPWEDKAFLIGFAVLIRREALRRTGLLDERFSPGTFEDNDLGLRLRKNGYRVILCHNSFIFHFPDTTGTNTAVWHGVFFKNRSSFIQKWGIDQNYYNYVRREIIDYISAPKNTPLCVLELGCAFGNTLNRIRYLWPNAEVWGIEYNEKIVDIVSGTSNIIRGDVETIDIPYMPEQFDYIICGDVLEHLRDPEKVLFRFKPYLKRGGHFIISLPNILHYSVLYSLLEEGRFDYKEEGIMDRTHLRFFTYLTAKDMLERCGLQIVKNGATKSYEGGQWKEFIEKLTALFPKISEMIQDYQMLFLARRIE